MKTILFENKRLFLLRVLILFILIFAFCEDLSWGKKDHTSLKKYLNLVGNTFYCAPEIYFFEIGSRAKENYKYLWPFNLEEADEKYRKITREIMQTAFKPVDDFSSNPLKVYLSVGLVRDKKAISALINVEITKPYLIIPKFWEKKEEKTFFKDVPIMVMKRRYLYIDEEYLSNKESGKYALAETIDKYFKEYLYDFVQRVLYCRELISK